VRGSLTAAIDELRAMQATDPDRYTLRRWARGVTSWVCNAAHALTPFAADFGPGAAAAEVRRQQEQQSRQPQAPPPPAAPQQRRASLAASSVGGGGTSCGVIGLDGLEPLPMSPSSYITPVARSGNGREGCRRSVAADASETVGAAVVALESVSAAGKPAATELAGSFKPTLCAHKEADD
jgi:hypothetical protein